MLMDTVADRVIALSWLEEQAAEVARGTYPAFLMVSTPAWWDWACRQAMATCAQHALRIVLAKDLGWLWGYRDVEMEEKIQSWCTQVRMDGLGAQVDEHREGT